jgi:hypothetical protein
MRQRAPLNKDHEDVVSSDDEAASDEVTSDAEGNEAILADIDRLDLSSESEYDS